MKFIFLFFFISTASFTNAQSDFTKTKDTIPDSDKSILTPSWRTLDKVFITAEKKESDLQKTPLSITVLNGREIKESRLWSLNGLSGIIPNLYTSHSGDLRNITSIRGIATTSYDQAITTYVDGVNQFTLDTYMPELFDVESVEIIRGPQGTLYGRNALGGVINVITKKPGNRFSAIGEVSVGNYGQKRLGGSVRIPLIKNKLFFGASALYEGHGGYFTNKFNDSKYDRQRKMYGNYNLKFYPTSRLQATLNVKHQINRNHGAFPLSSDPESAFNEPYLLNQNSLTVMRDNNLNASLSVKYNTNGGIRIQSQTSWQKNYRFYTDPIDADFSPLDAVSIVNNYGKKFNNVNVYTQELNIHSKPGSRLEWSTGAYFFLHNNPVKQGTYFGDNADLLGLPDKLFTLVNTNIGRNYGSAVYGQFTYPITSALHFTAGARLDAEKRKLTVSGEYQKSPNIVIPLQSDTTGETSFTALSPKLGLVWQRKESQMLFLTYSKGFRTGGLTNLGLSSSQKPLYPYAPEHSHNFELGWKSQFSNKLRINVTAFYSFIRDIQIPTLIMPDAITVIRNAAKLNSKGVEVELEATPIKGLELIYRGGLTYANYSGLSILKEDQMVFYRKNRQIFTPNYTSASIAQYSIPLKMDQRKSVSFRAEWLAFGSQYFDLSNEIKQEAYGVLNTRIALRWGKIELSVWGRNITDKRYLAYGYDFGAVYMAPPRQLGTSLIIEL